MAIPGIRFSGRSSPGSRSPRHPAGLFEDETDTPSGVLRLPSVGHVRVILPGVDEAVVGEGPGVREVEVEGRPGSKTPESKPPLRRWRRARGPRRRRAPHPPPAVVHRRAAPRPRAGGRGPFCEVGPVADPPSIAPLRGPEAPPVPVARRTGRAGRRRSLRAMSSWQRRHRGPRGAQREYPSPTRPAARPVVCRQLDASRSHDSRRCGVRRSSSPEVTPPRTQHRTSPPDRG